MMGTQGFSLVELLIATVIALIVTALACVMVVEVQTMWRGDHARVDLQQRGRVAADVVMRTLLEAGAGPNIGLAKGPLLRAVAPVLPRRVGRRGADPPDRFRVDAVSALHALAEAEHTTLRLAAMAGTMTLEIAATSCRLPACGFAMGSTVMLHDGSGNFDVFTVIDVQGLSLTVRHHGSGSAVDYPSGSPVTHVESRSLYVVPADRTLRIYDGDGNDLPVLDDVVEMRVEYGGTTLPPVWPRPANGQANCLYDVDGTFQTSLMPVLAGGTSLVALEEAALTDGPWCGSGGNQFDADLLRVRQVRVMLRLQASDPMARGGDPVRFRRPGTARSEAVMAPDVTVGIVVTPPNLRPAW